MFLKLISVCRYLNRNYLGKRWDETMKKTIINYLQITLERCTERKVLFNVFLIIVITKCSITSSVFEKEVVVA